GATKHKLAAPKAKYVEHILIATHAGEAGIAEVFRALNNRLRDSSWTTIFKALIVVHYMMREGEKDVTLRYLRRNPRVIALSHYSDGQIQGKNIRNYSNYLNERARTYGDVRTDYVRDGEGKLRKLSVDKGLLREVESVQMQIKALLKCTFLDDEVDNEITLLAFRLLVSDLLELFHVVNEGVINVLEHYFEMSRHDAERALKIYKVFTNQTSDVVEFLQAARRVEVSTRLQIPNIKHAPTSLTSSLEEYLNDPDFDVNRRQYLAQKEANGGAKKPAQSTSGKTSPAQPGPTPTEAPSAKEPPKIAPDLIDFFESIETEQTPMFGNQPAPQEIPQIIGPAPQIMVNPYTQQQVYVSQPQIPQMVPAPQVPAQTGGFPIGFQQTNPFPQPIHELQVQPYPQIPQPSIQELPVQPVQPHFTGAGFGGYTPQDQQPVMAELPVPAIPQQFVQQQQQLQNFQQPPPPAGLQIPSQTGTNPFRQSVLAANTGTANFATSPPSQQSKSTNPFARTTQTSPTTLTATAGSPAQGFAPQSPPQNSNMLGRSATTAGTGTNPFARGTNTSPQATGSSGLSVPGGTNPFRASMMLQQQQ
ncbi:ANTH-domain-containing protein, partial [Wilcoxina mikolae CBS 423.85]